MAKKDTSYSTVFFFLAPVGLTLVLFSTNILYEALNIQAKVEQGILGILTGLLLIMMVPIMALAKDRKDRNKKG